jgi:hypothetical protein
VAAKGYGEPSYGHFAGILERWKRVIITRRARMKQKHLYRLTAAVEKK